jgi:hypothetical protein
VDQSCSCILIIQQFGSEIVAKNYIMCMLVYAYVLTLYIGMYANFMVAKT